MAKIRSTKNKIRGKENKIRGKENIIGGKENQIGGKENKIEGKENKFEGIKNILKSNDELFICLSIFYALFLLSFLYVAKPLITGDGHEYLGMTVSFFNHLSPELLEKDILLRNHVENINNYHFIASLDYNGYYKSLSGAYYSWHFWFYSLLNLPAFSLLHWFGMNELRCFQITNSILLFISLVVILYCFKEKKQRLIMFLFLAFSPALFYIDWSHPEVFSYSFVIMSISFANIKKYKSAVLLSSVASLQNPPIAVLTFYMIYMGWRESKWNIKEISLLVLTSVVSVLPYLFYYINYHTPSLITREGMANFSYLSLDKVLSLFFDLNFGIIVYLPVLFLLAVTSLFLSLKKKNVEILLLWIVLILMALICSTQRNWNSGMLYINRYDVYIIPIFVLITIFSTKYYPPNKLNAVLLIGFIFTTLITFACLNNYNQSTYLQFTDPAREVLVDTPEFYNPPFEVFAERTLKGEFDYSQNLPIVYVYDNKPRKILTDYEHIKLIENLIDPSYKEKTIDEIQKCKIGYINSHETLLTSQVNQSKVQVIYRKGDKFVRISG